MDDNVIPMLGGKRVYRRKRRWQGATWTPPMMNAAKEDGVWCPIHRIHHGYKSSQLVTDYEKRSDGGWRLLWLCKMTGNVLGEVNLGAVQVSGGGRREDREGRIGPDRVGDGEVDST